MNPFPSNPWVSLKDRFEFLKKFAEIFTAQGAPLYWCRWHWWQIYRRCCWYRGQYATGVVDTGDKFAASMVDNSVKFAKVGVQMFFKIRISQICKFLGSFCNQKSANFWDMWVQKFQIHKFLLIKMQKANPLISYVSSWQIANPQIFHHKTERMKHLIFSLPL